VPDAVTQGFDGAETRMAASAVADLLAAHAIFLVREH
jgi:hypothetical protein